MAIQRFFGLVAFLMSSCSWVFAAEPVYDVVIYGGTSAGVIAAVQAKQLGKSVIIVCPDKHLGGLTSSGLGMTDTGNKAGIGGLARDFYHRVWKEYQKPETWRWQKRSEYKGKGQGTVADDGEFKTMWVFEPHIAEKVFEYYVREFDIAVARDQWLDRSRVKKSGSRISTITMLSGDSYSGKIFMDATYEVRLSYPPNNNRSSKVRVEVVHAEGSQVEWIDQKKKPDIDSLFVSLGVYVFSDVQPAAVVVSNSEANGYVIVDAVQWLPK